MRIGELRALIPVRGKLCVFVRTDAHRNEAVVCAMLEGDVVGEHRLPVLDHMRLTRMRGDSFVLVGFEEIQMRRTVEVYPQAWWCRLVHKGASQPTEVDDEEAGALASV